MTGCGPARHGVFDHRYYDAAADQMKVNNATRLPIPTVWHLLSQAGRSIVSLNLPGTFPPLDVRGIVVWVWTSPHLDAALLGAPVCAAASRRSPRLLAALLLAQCPQTLDELAENSRLTAKSFHGRAGGGLLADEMQPDWSVLMVQFQNLDPFQHRAVR